MSESPTHKLVKTPKINSRYLSDYMVASERARRTIIRDCKFPRIARVMQHDLAKSFITNALRSGELSSMSLREEGDRMLNMMADTDFEREKIDNNGDFLLAYAEVFSMETLPSTCEIVDADTSFRASINGVDVRPDIRFGLVRVTRTNRLRTGLGTIRYAKNKPLDVEAGSYQSSMLFGFRKMMDVHDDDAPEAKLCVTLDCASGRFIPAPSDATRRFQNMEAACATIAERWDNIEPPDGAVIG
ncbi:hypothetical protein PE067_08425 [Paracoccus sp. DMF-8]|uniref:hypothetical protein n=1 Tax=Paracoccus sp. DMF-8 TaxID=3019445 RepID=UPI0023E85F7E|nr:hypothetical protein [Paracoccus sp. DMF-8]MDF3606152.1 hypothetical protein [Paracoccus sp. DMF-8]